MDEPSDAVVVFVVVAHVLVGAHKRSVKKGDDGERRGGNGSTVDAAQVVIGESGKNDSNNKSGVLGDKGRSSASCVDRGLIVVVMFTSFRFVAA